MHRDRTINATLEDVSERGIFAQIEPDILRGTIVRVLIKVSSRKTLDLKARVAHALDSAAATVLGRSPGLGFRFMFEDGVSRMEWIEFLASREREVSRNELHHDAGLILLADPHEGLRQRLARGLSVQTTMEVETVNSGSSALELALETFPDVIVAAVDMPEMGGLELLRKMQKDFRLREIPVILTLLEEAHLVRLEAFRSGAADVIAKPFTDEEISLRVRRVVVPGRITEPHAHLRGHLGELSLGTLLSLLDVERKSGIITLIRGQDLARLYIFEGRLVRIEGPTNALSPLDRAMCVLEWDSAKFEFLLANVAPDDHLKLSTQQLLLEHARVMDESS